MIEKLSFLDTSVNCVDYKGLVHNVADSSIINKINEIIALLNAIVVDVDGSKCIDGSKAPAENVLTKSLRMDKEFAEAECMRLQNELERTRKALDKAKWWLKEIVENHRFTPISTAEMALKEITALEQKDVK